MSRKWDQFELDEIAGIWKGYQRTEFEGWDILNQSPVKDKPVRLTPMEIIRLVDNLLDRLIPKEAEE